MTDDATAALSLLNAAAVRARAEQMLALALSDKLPHFRVELGLLDQAGEFVAAVTRQNYPSLDIPFHSRWRHFVRHGCDHAARLLEEIPDARARARAAFDLAIISVLLDAGAGAQWRYRDPVTGETFSRSEGLAAASLTMFRRGDFCATGRKLRADAASLAGLSPETLRHGLQIGSGNPFVGVESRAELLRALGRLALARPDIFAREDTARCGGFFDHLAAKADNGAIPAPLILSELLQHFGPIWPSRLELGGVPLGDCWRHPAMVANDATSSLVPLHKLSQWLAYSLIEPLQQAGYIVRDIDGLTGLAEYRNGGLFLDMGVLALRDPEQSAFAHEVAAPLVVEWRALTVALLDRLAGVVRRKLGKDAATLPLARILQGGTWAAGRALAFARRADGSAPIKVVSDGTVF